MSTIVSHAAVPIALSTYFPDGILSPDAVQWVSSAR